ncbi:villin-1 isoform X1 [Neltuma alba]|uniref:villin-1 isoform X1 n=1 Tax=Neltuma alba TaxID=207710 RepID=UPI0010A2C4FC|nr:villin-1 isoform X1 [Prosopis alba]XP_028779935.1 villin-1 isoform X1 [Prosopis alba]
MPVYTKDLDSAFQTAGAKPGIEVWCIENQHLVSVPHSCHGKFYTGSAYIVLNTVFPKSGPPQHDLHYWLGNDANKVDSALASDKALELDAALGSCSVQYREIQGQESQKFLSYFKPCIIPIEGVFTSKEGNLSGEYQVSLYSCKGDHVVRVKEVPFLRSSLNHDDVFILDTASKIFLFSGCNSTIQERAKALEVIQYIKENKHNGNCEVATIEDGKFVGDSDVGEFWNLFGGYAPIPRELPSAQEQPVDSSIKLFWINLQGKLCQAGKDALSKEMLETDKCYMLDCGTEIYVWMGRQTLLTERKTSISAVENFLRNEGRSNGTHLTFLSEGLESAIFRSYFGNWPKMVETTLYEEGREKVAAIFKYQGYDVKELPEEHSEPLINCRGMLKVWRVDGDKLSLLSDEEQTKLFSGDCYIAQFTFPGNERDETLIYAWLGHRCTKVDKTSAISHINAMVDSVRTNPVVAQIHEGKEPTQFFEIFQRLFIFKGGISSGYKNFIEESGMMDETYGEKKVALIRVQGTSPDNMQAIQVDHVSGSLNSSYCYILQTGASVFTWIGSLSTAQDHNLLDRMVELLNPTLQPISVREGNEPTDFWDTLGGKAEYPREKEIQKHAEDPHLFVLNINGGDFKVREIYNFTQDDLVTEDILLLDCQKEIYVWMGLHSVVRSKQEALNLGLKFIEMDVLVEDLSPETPIYVVTEGHEPPLFTRFFVWDYSKANMHGNSFERKLAILKGKQHALEAHHRTPRKASSRNSTPNGQRSLSVSSNGRGRSSSPASLGMRSDYKSLTPDSVAKKLFHGSPSYNSPVSFSASPPAEPNLSSGTAESLQKNGNKDIENLPVYPYDRLRVISSNPVVGINVTVREAYLSDEEFREKFGMTKAAFYKLPKWKQNKLKMSLDLF